MSITLFKETRIEYIYWYNKTFVFKNSECLLYTTYEHKMKLGYCPGVLHETVNTNVKSIDDRKTGLHSIK